LPSASHSAKPWLCVGIIGHRPNRLPQDAARRESLRGAIRTILLAARAAARPAGPCAVSSLAEGADRIFAEEALALGYALLCPMPFIQAEFEKDFLPPSALEPASLAHFRALLEKARAGSGLAVQELDGRRAEAPSAYADAGCAVLDQSDFLIAVWDGAEAAGQGGTAETLREGLSRHIPIFWIDARAPENRRLLCDETDLGTETTGAQPELERAVTQLVRSILAR
jgi:hypothetical protein